MGHKLALTLELGIGGGRGETPPPHLLGVATGDTRHLQDVQGIERGLRPDRGPLGRGFVAREGSDVRGTHAVLYTDKKELILRAYSLCYCM